MSKAKVEQADPYTCTCGTVIAHKRKSLKKHLQTKAHLDTIVPCPPHHWTIDAANGHLSNGYCIKCNKKQKFENSIGAYTWTGRAQKEYEDEEREKEEQEEISQLVATE